MDDLFERKYKKVLEILPDVAECAQGKLVLVGGTALALFYLKHRTSIDLDFVPVARGADEKKLKETLRGCLTKKGYRTSAGAYQNQFIVQFEDTSIKIEVFEPEQKIGSGVEHVFGGTPILVAALEDLFAMKQSAYKDRKEARDLFDIFCILKTRGESFGTLKKLIAKSGLPKNVGDVDAMALNKQDRKEFKTVISDAST